MQKEQHLLLLLLLLYIRKRYSYLPSFFFVLFFVIYLSFIAMAPSGLDSIALAVAHLERAEKASLSVADDSSSPTASEFSKTGLPTSLFLNHTRVVSTDGLDAKAPSSSSPVASQSPHLPPPPPSSSLAYYSPSPLMENRQWNHISAFVPSLSVTAATTTHGFALPTPSTFTLPSHAPPQTLHSVLRRCSSPSSANNNSNNNKKTSTPHQKPLKNLSLLFEMAPYPIPKDIATTTNTTTTTTTSDIRDDDVLCGR